MTSTRSLRTRLFILIVGPLILVAAFAATVRYILAEQTSERLYDKTLQAVALAISRDVVLSEGDILAEGLLEALTTALGDPFYYRVSGPDGRFLTGYSDLPPQPPGIEVIPGEPQFYDADYYGDRIRVVILREFISEPQFGGWVTVQVWQTVHQRTALSLELLLQAVALMAVVILAAGAAVWFGINLGLRPLLQLREAIKLRSPDDLGPIRRPVPREVKSLVEETNKLFEQLSTAFAERDSLISNAAHQLRNPIAAIQAQAEAAETAPNEAELRLRVRDVAEAARRTSRLTQQLLSLEKASGRSARSSGNEVDLGEIAAEVAKVHAPGALRRGVELSFEVDGVGSPVHGDPILLSEALDNLIDNALRYGCSDGGRVTVRIEYGPDTTSLIVHDDGPGIPKEQRELVFERFHRAAGDSVEGCGLGLAIARKVAERHGGSLGLAETKIGARFELKLPRAA